MKLSEYLEEKIKVVARNKNFFITDLGRIQVLETKTRPGFRTEGPTKIKHFELPRYGVWSLAGGKPEVIETSNDLKLLKERYNLEGDQE